MDFFIRKYLCFGCKNRALRVSAIITLLGVALSTAVLVISLSVAHGFETAYKRSIIDFNAHVVLFKDNGDIAQYDRLMDDVLKTEGITGAMPFIYRESLMVNKGMIKGVVVKGVDFRRLPDVSRMSVKCFDASPDCQNNAQSVFLGRPLAEKFGINAGTDINLLTGKNKFQKVRVVGTFESGLYDYDSQFMLAPIAKVQKIFGVADVVSGIELKTNDPDSAYLMARFLEEQFGYPYRTTSWAELNKPIFEAVHLEKIMFAIIVGVLVLIGMFNIIGTLVLRILSKVRDIAILNALGMYRAKIRRIFTFQGLVLGVTGTFLGISGGLALVWLIGSLKLIHIEPEIYFLSSLPFQIEWYVVSLIALVGVIVSWLISFVAAGRAAQLSTLYVRDQGIM